MDVAFASTSVPEGTQIGNVLVEAASNITAFNVDLNSIVVNGSLINIPSNSTTAPPTLNTTANASMSTTARTPPTTTIAVVPASPAAVTSEAVTTRRLTFRSAGETFTTDLLNSSSAAFQRRASLITSNLVLFYQTAFATFRNLTVTSFGNGSIINNMDVAFASTSVPEGTQIGNVLVEAASNITAFNVDLNSIVVNGSLINIPSNSTTAPPTLNTTANASMSTTARTPPTTTIAVVPASPAAVTSEAVTTRRLTFRSAGETFTTDLLNPSSAEFQRRASLITSTLVPFYLRAFPTFRSLTVTSFSNGSVINNMTIVFSSTSGPEGTQIGNVLVEAASTITAFNVDLNSIVVDGSQPNITSSSTTAPSTLNTAAPITAAPVTSQAVTTRRLIFRSAGETFTTDLLNPSSAAFQRRASLITSNLVPFYLRAFPTFRSLTVTSFSNGSIINNMDLGFSSTSVPNGTQIRNVLVQAASTITAFNVDLNSIVVDGSQVSSGVSHKISLITASFLVLLSWILSSQQ
nr:mucin-5AC-like [Gasterosteus aculeatus aculeatus]